MWTHHYYEHIFVESPNVKQLTAIALLEVSNKLCKATTGRRQPDEWSAHFIQKKRNQGQLRKTTSVNMDESMDKYVDKHMDERINMAEKSQDKTTTMGECSRSNKQ